MKFKTFLTKLEVAAASELNKGRRLSQAWTGWLHKIARKFALMAKPYLQSLISGGLNSTTKQSMRKQLWGELRTGVSPLLAGILAKLLWALAGWIIETGFKLILRWLTSVIDQAFAVSSTASKYQPFLTEAKAFHSAPMKLAYAVPRGRSYS